MLGIYAIGEKCWTTYFSFDEAKSAYDAAIEGPFFVRTQNAREKRMRFVSVRIDELDKPARQEGVSLDLSQTLKLVCVHRDLLLELVRLNMVQRLPPGDIRFVMQIVEESELAAKRATLDEVIPASLPPKETKKSNLYLPPWYQ